MLRGAEYVLSLQTVSAVEIAAQALQTLLLALILDSVGRKLCHGQAVPATSSECFSNGGVRKWDDPIFTSRSFYVIVN